MIPVKIKIEPGAKAPEYQSKGAAGADLHAFLEQPVTLKPGRTQLIPTGVYIELPEGYEAQIRPRSGLALKHGITLLNTPGTIDCDYRGEIKLIISNFGQDDFIVTNEMRIAQMIFNKVHRGHFIPVEVLNETGRNEGGFGHSGV
ncbi:MAG: dUTP diphosphatase [bacterium]|nr:dUTP diphosphatase [bacterium]